MQKIIPFYHSGDDASLAFPNICLIGMAGCGKTTIGKTLSRRLHVHFIDIDEVIEERSGLTIAEMFAQWGEPFFRGAEMTTLQWIVDDDKSGIVLSTGGGILWHPLNVQRIRTYGSVVWLRRPLNALTEEDRLARPLLQKSDAAARLYRDREPLYRAAADFVVDNIGTPEETADEILQMVFERILPT